MKDIKRKILLFLIATFLLLGCSLSTNLEKVVPATATSIPNVAPSNPLVPPSDSLVTNEEAILVDLYQRVNPAVVNIRIYQRLGAQVAPSGEGSGFVYDAKGHIVTNSHVVHGADEIEVWFWDGSAQTAELIGEDLHSDLAVIKVDQLPEGVQPLPLGDLESVAVGQTVVAIGNPFGLGGTMTRGIVSALGRTIPALTQFSIPQAIQTDAPINPGNSGGPLLNLKGEVIGVNAQIETGGTSNTNSGIGFAIPVSIIKIAVPQLIEKGEVVWPWLGVVGGSLDPTLIEGMNLPVSRGAYIAEIVKGGPADKAGLRGAQREINVNGHIIAVGGDVIIAIDGNPVHSFEDLLIYIALKAKPGQKVTLTIIRNGVEQQITVVLEARPETLP